MSSFSVVVTHAVHAIPSVEMTSPASPKNGRDCVLKLKSMAPGLASNCGKQARPAVPSILRGHLGKFKTKKALGVVDLWG